MGALFNLTPGGCCWDRGGHIVIAAYGNLQESAAAVEPVYVPLHSLWKTNLLLQVQGLHKEVPR